MTGGLGKESKREREKAHFWKEEYKLMRRVEVEVLKVKPEVIRRA